MEFKIKALIEKLQREIEILERSQTSNFFNTRAAFKSGYSAGILKAKKDMLENLKTMLTNNK